MWELDDIAASADRTETREARTAVETGAWRPRREPFPLGETVRGALRPAAQAAARKGLRFHIEIEPAAEGVIEADAGALRRIVAALADNAVRFTERGAVSVSAAVEPTGERRIVVSDTGTGMTETERAGLFHPDERDLHAPTDAARGLLRAQRLAGAMGAKLSCESMPRVGSAFVLALPGDVAPAGYETGPAAPSATPRPTQTARRDRAVRDASPSSALRLRPWPVVEAALAGVAT